MDLDVPNMRRVVEQVGGCIVWGGAVQLSPADDVLIRIERPLDLDGVSQMVASVLSKKSAAGSKRVLIDIPVGPTAKVRSSEAAAELGTLFLHVGDAIGLQLQVVVTDGSQPVGRGIGPALEARDVVSVLQGLPLAPADLRERALLLAGKLLEFGGKVTQGRGLLLATQVLESGQAWSQFKAICEAQGGMREPPIARHVVLYPASHGGTVLELDNRRLALVAKLAGAPRAPAAGITLDVKRGDVVMRGQPLFHLHAQTLGELQYAQAYARGQHGLIAVGNAG